MWVFISLERVLQKANCAKSRVDNYNLQLIDSGANERDWNIKFGVVCLETLYFHSLLSLLNDLATVI